MKQGNPSIPFQSKTDSHTPTRERFRVERRDPESMVKSGFSESLAEAKIPFVMVIDYGQWCACGTDIAAVPDYDGTGEAVAAKVAQSLNFHQELVDSLREILDLLMEIRPEFSSLPKVVKAEAALARAEEGQ